MPIYANWRSRGYLPHCDGVRLVQHVVFGLDDATPPSQSFDNDDLLDAGHGSCVLRVKDAACAVEDTLLHSDGERYRIVAWCVMPNHVHVVFEQLEDLATTVQAWKSVSAHSINAILGRSGRLWRREYFDRFIRGPQHLIDAIAYVENNPVKAGLAATPQDWPYSSARRKES